MLAGKEVSLMDNRYSRISIAAVSGIAFLLCGLFAAGKASSLHAVAQRTRSFRLGFVPFVPDTTPQAANQVTQFIKENADIVAEHMESIPWAEALSGAPFNQNLMKDWRSRKKNGPKIATIKTAV